MAGKRGSSAVLREARLWLARLFTPPRLAALSVPEAWKGMPHVWGEFPQVPTMLSGEELQLLYWLARDAYSGLGAVVDLGAFLGGSTCALAAGLRDNPGRFRKRHAVGAFDRFLYEAAQEFWVGPTGASPRPGDSLLPLFRRLTEPYREYLTAHPGDLLAARYEGGPIEVLVVDVGESWELSAAVLAEFFPHLIPGRSVVVRRGCHRGPIVAFDYLGDHLEHTGRVADGSAAVYRYARRIPEVLLRTDLRALPLERKRLAFERELARCCGGQKADTLLCYTHTLLEAGDEAGAREVFDRLEPAGYTPPSGTLDLSGLPRHFYAWALRGAWREMPHVWAEFPQVPTMLSGEELQLLYWLTRDVYSGLGTVVDLGPFLGGSTCALAAGLRDNPGRFPRENAIHAFDHFLYNDPWLDFYTRRTGETFRDGDSFLPLYRRLTAAYGRYVNVHPGDLLEAEYAGGPVEILFIDIAKSWELNAAVLAKFFPHLITGRSVVVQQDYLNFYHCWLIIAMDFFGDYFEHLGRVAEGCSAVYRYTRRIPDALLRTDLRALPLERKRLAFERELARCDGWQKTEILICYTRMLWEAGDDRAAQEVFDRLDPVWYDHPLNKVGMGFVPPQYRRTA
jgi:hypothetical protein